MVSLTDDRKSGLKAAQRSRPPVFRDLAPDQRAILRAALDGFDADDVAAACGDGTAAADAAYARGTLQLDRFREVAGARWAQGRACPLHGHAGSAVLLRVLSGELIEERYVPAVDGYRYEVVTLRPGDESWLPPGSFHRIACMNDAATVHVFDPPSPNAVAPLPDKVLPALERAKAQAAAFAFTTERCRSSIESVITEYGPAWSGREESETLAGRTRVAPDTLADWRATGVLAAPIPRELGGWGATLAEVAASIRALARTAPATALALAMPLGNAATCRIPASAVPAESWSALAEGRAWVAAQAMAGRILAVANSEPGAGGELSQTRTLATPDERGVYRLTGRKSFATIGPDADYFLCAARRSGEAGGGDVIDGFFVARGAAGVTLDDNWDPLGMRATASVGVTLNRAEASAVLGYPGCLHSVNARHWSTVLFAAVFVGVAEGAISAAISAIGESGARSYFARASLAECALNVEAAAGLLEAVAANDQVPLPPPARERTVRAKTFAAKVAVDVATRCATLCGGRAYRAGHVISRLLHDALAGPLLRPPVASAMDSIVAQMFPQA